MKINCFVLSKHLNTKHCRFFICWVTLKSWKQGKHDNNFKLLFVLKGFSDFFCKLLGYFIFMWHKKLIFDIDIFSGFLNETHVSIVNGMLSFFDPCAPLARASAKLQLHMTRLRINHKSFNDHLFCCPIWLVLNQVCKSWLEMAQFLAYWYLFWLIFFILINFGL